MLRPSREHFPSSTASPLHSSHMTRVDPCFFALRTEGEKKKKHRCALLPTAAAAFKRRAAAVHPINTGPAQPFLSPWRRPADRLTPRRQFTSGVVVTYPNRRPSSQHLSPTTSASHPERARLCSWHLHCPRAMPDARLNAPISHVNHGHRPPSFLCCCCSRRVRGGGRRRRARAG